MNLIPVTDPELKQQLVRQAKELTESAWHLSLAWIRQHEWIAVPVESGLFFDETDVRRLAAAMQAAGYRECYAVALEPIGDPPPPECGLVPATPEGLADFNDECASFYYILLSADASFAVLCTHENYNVVAGPLAFVTPAVGGDIQRARHEFEESALGWRTETDQKRLLDVARRYEQLKADE